MGADRLLHHVCHTQNTHQVWRLYMVQSLYAFDKTFSVQKKQTESMYTSASQLFVNERLRVAQPSNAHTLQFSGLDSWHHRFTDSNPMFSSIKYFTSLFNWTIGCLPIVEVQLRCWFSSSWPLNKIRIKSWMSRWKLRACWWKTWQKWLLITKQAVLKN